MCQQLEDNKKKDGCFFTKKMVSHNSFQPEKKGKNNQENIRNARGSPIQTICALLELNPRKREIPLKNLHKDR